MPEIIETTVYRLDELSNEAKEKARAWYRQVGLDHDWFEFVYDDFERICAILGVSLKTVPVRLYGGKSLASGSRASGVRAMALASRGGTATRPAQRVRFAIMHRRTMSFIGSPMSCRQSSGGTSTSSTPP